MGVREGIRPVDGSTALEKMPSSNLSALISDIYIQTCCYEHTSGFGTAETRLRFDVERVDPSDAVGGVIDIYRANARKRVL